MSIWSWLKLTAALWLIRKGVKAFGWLLVAAVAVAAWPLTAAAAIGYLAAWLRGWPPSRLWHAAAWALPMTAVYAIGEALRLRAWQAVALAPVNDWGQRLGPAGRSLHAPGRAARWPRSRSRPGWRSAGCCGRGGSTPSPPAWPGCTAAAPIMFDARQWRRQARAARGRAAAPGAVPLLTRRGGLIVIGATIRAIRHRWRPVHTVPVPPCRPAFGDRRLVRAAGRRT